MPSPLFTSWKCLKQHRSKYTKAQTHLVPSFWTSMCIYQILNPVSKSTNIDNSVMLENIDWVAAIHHAIGCYIHQLLLLLVKDFPMSCLLFHSLNMTIFQATHTAMTPSLLELSLAEGYVTALNHLAHFFWNVQWNFLFLEMWTLCSLVPRPLPDFISQLWRNISRRPGTNTVSQGNGGLG